MVTSIIALAMAMILALAAFIRVIIGIAAACTQAQSFFQGILNYFGFGKKKEPEPLETLNIAYKAQNELLEDSMASDASKQEKIEELQEKLADAVQLADSRGDEIRTLKTRVDVLSKKEDKSDEIDYSFFSTRSAV